MWTSNVDIDEKILSQPTVKQRTGSVDVPQLNDRITRMHSFTRINTGAVM